MKLFSHGSLARNFLYQFMGQGSGYALRVAYFVIIARLLGVQQYGLVVGSYSLVNVVAQYSRLGMGVVMLRYVSGDFSRFAVYWGNILLVTSTVGSLLVFGLQLIAPHILDLETAKVVAATAVATCLLEQITISATQAFQAAHRMAIAAAMDQMTNLFRVIAAAQMLFFLHHATARQWVMTQVVVSACATAVALCVTTVILGWPKFDPSGCIKHVGEGVEYSFAASTQNIYNDLDKTMMSHYGRSTENGIYGLAYRILEMGTSPITALAIASFPRLFAMNETAPEKIRQNGLKLLGVGIKISVVVSICLFFASNLIPLVLGSAFSEAAVALRWLCVIPVFRSIHGVAGNLLTAMGKQRYRTLSQVAAVILNFSVNLWVIPSYGWKGAALSSVLTDGFLALLCWTVFQIQSNRPLEKAISL
jgi:O-antigen/teichoic acid export membrane protein